jgi:orotidine-5'-phosphate decarboxylase
MKAMTHHSSALPHQSVFVALDVPERDTAVQLARSLQPHVGGFKIGLELFCSLGPSIVEEIGAANVFLDLKLHDIPNTVAGASRALAHLGVKIFNYHCLGGHDMMRAGAEATREINAQTKIIGVTILTSHDAAGLRTLGLQDEPRDAVRRLALLAREAGLDGVVCSPQEIELVRSECGPEFLIVTPGIRPSGAAVGDQKRVMTPREALDKGADWLVIGRPITAAPNPAQAAQNVFA